MRWRENIVNNSKINDNNAKTLQITAKMHAPRKLNIVFGQILLNRGIVTAKSRLFLGDSLDWRKTLGSLA